MHDPGRRVGNRSDAARQLGQRLGLDLLDQAADDVVEQRDVLVAEMRRRRRGIALVTRRKVSARRSGVPCWTTSSSSGIRDAAAAPAIDEPYKTGCERTKQPL